jgi:hypothetical protein
LWPIIRDHHGFIIPILIIGRCDLTFTGGLSLYLDALVLSIEVKVVLWLNAIESRNVVENLLGLIKPLVIVVELSTFLMAEESYSNGNCCDQERHLLCQPPAVVDVLVGNADQNDHAILHRHNHCNKWLFVLCRHHLQQVVEIDYVFARLRHS